MSSSIKQFGVVRRRAGQSIQQFHNYHYQQHGRISAASIPEETPQTYFQTHHFDSVYSSSSLAQPPWSGHNGSTELYFRDMAHLGKLEVNMFGRLLDRMVGISMTSRRRSPSLLARSAFPAMKLWDREKSNLSWRTGGFRLTILRRITWSLQQS